ncbi:MAG: ArnT family glycosyltransferase [Candidatus Zixiibacteriota bacterium]
MISFSLVIVCGAVAALLGLRLLSLFRTSPEGEGRLFYAYALGWGVIAYLVLLLGLFGGLYPVGVILILALCFLLGIGKLKTLGKDLRAFVVSLWESAREVLPVPLLLVTKILVALILLVSFVGAFAPPTNMDALNYHLAVPKLYLQTHTIVFLPTMLYSATPFASEMINSLFMLIKGEVSAQLAQHLFGWALLFALFSFAKSRYGSKGGLLAVAGFLCLSSFISVFSEPKNDMLITLFSLLAVWSLLSWNDSEKRSDLALVGVFAGLASGTKLFGLGVAFSLFVVLLVLMILKRYRLSKISTSLLTTLAFFSLFAFPWYLKSYLWSGNPVYPFFYGFFGGNHWNGILDYRVFQLGREAYLPVNFINLVISPWLIVNRGEIFLARTGVVFLAILPGLFLFRKLPREIKTLGWFSLIYYLLWFLFLRDARYLLPIIPPIAMICAFIILRLEGRSKLLKWLLMLTIILGSGANLLTNLKVQVPKFPGVFGTGSEQEFYQDFRETERRDHTSGKLVEAFPEYEFSRKANELLFPDSKLAVFSLDQAFYYYFFDYPYILALPMRQSLVDFASLRNEEDVSKRLRELGITHIATDVVLGGGIPDSSLLVTDSHFAPLLPGVNAFLSMLKSRSILIHQENGFYLYELVGRMQIELPLVRTRDCSSVLRR